MYNCERKAWRQRGNEYGKHIVAVSAMRSGRKVKVPQGDGGVGGDGGETNRLREDDA